jgi:hypothetical protein
LDSLHVMAAAHCGADELTTSEKRGKPIHRTSLCKILTIR